MSASVDEQEGQPLYRIKVRGRLGPGWSDWLGALSVQFEQERDGYPSTVLTGRVADQAALRGILARIWDLNLNVISVIRIERPPSRSPENREGKKS
jgi:hypothetical protein